VLTFLLPTSAGGGGKKENRKAKIQEKNRKLDENREKRINKEHEIKLEKSKDQEGQADIMHPSRRAMISRRGR
jgi:nucleolar protein 6